MTVHDHAPPVILRYSEGSRDQRGRCLHPEILRGVPLRMTSASLCTGIWPIWTGEDTNASTPVSVVQQLPLFTGVSDVSAPRSRFEDVQGRSARSARAAFQRAANQYLRRQRSERRSL